MAVHAGIGHADQRPGLGDIDPLGNAHHVARIDIEHLLHRILDAFELGFLEDVEIFGDHILRIVDHLEVLDEFDLRGLIEPAMLARK